MDTSPTSLEQKTRLGLTPAAALLAGIVILAAGLRLLDPGALGYANHYYSAAIESMLQSWHNFFFAAAEPGGAVSVDKPPLGLWLQAASAFIFGVNGFAMLLPQIVAGVLSVIVLYFLVRRWFSPAAGLLAALALAISPVAIAVDRNNTMDSTLILALLCAAWAFMRAAENGKLRFMLLGAFLVGIAFNIKMLQAFLPLPAFYALYLLGSPERLWRKLVNLALASLVLTAVSLSWALIVDFTPPEERPYVGSSTNNTVTELITGHNGLLRLLGRDGQLGANVGQPAQGQPPGQNPQPGAPANPQRPVQPQQPVQPLQSGRPAAPLQQRQPPAGFGGVGAPGALRLFTAPLDNESAWFLPFGLFSLALLLFGTHWRWPVARPHQAMILWGGWALTAVVFFSAAEFFHEYYLTMLAAPLAALLAIGFTQLWRLGKAHPTPAAALAVLAAGITLGVQFLTAGRYLAELTWLAAPVALFGLGAALLMATAQPALQRGAIYAYACTAAALMLIPLAWSALTALHSSPNQSLPASYSGQDSSGPSDRGSLHINQKLLDLLLTDTQDVKYLLAVPSSMQGADFVLATGRPVLYIGGFLGSDPVVSATDLARMVAQNELRYIYWDVDTRGRSDINRWVLTACSPVPGFTTRTRNAGAPDGAGLLTQNPGGMGELTITLYRCVP